MTNGAAQRSAASIPDHPQRRAPTTYTFPRTSRRIDYVWAREGSVQSQSMVDVSTCVRTVADCFCQFTAKQLNRQANKAGKDEQTEKGKLKKVCPLLVGRTWHLPSVGDTTRPRRHREDLCTEYDPETERKAQPTQTGLTDRCGIK